MIGGDSGQCTTRSKFALLTVTKDSPWHCPLPKPIPFKSPVDPSPHRPIAHRILDLYTVLCALLPSTDHHRRPPPSPIAPLLHTDSTCPPSFALTLTLTPTLSATPSRFGPMACTGTHSPVRTVTTIDVEMPILTTDLVPIGQCQSSDVECPSDTLVPLSLNQLKAGEVIQRVRNSHCTCGRACLVTHTTAGILTRPSSPDARRCE